MITIVIDAIPISLNKSLRLHWTKRREELTLWKWLILEWKNKNKAKIFKGKVRVKIKYFFKTRGIHDTDNYSGKNIYDALKGQIIEEDNSRVVTSLPIEFGYDKEKPRTEISIYGGGAC